MQLLENVVVFNVGVHNGQPFSHDDLDAIVESFAVLGLGGRVPIKLGHADQGETALGWVTRLRRDGDRLAANLELTAEAARLVESGGLRFMSCELLRDVTDGQGRMFRWTLDAVALLGVHRPAVDSVSNLAALIASRPRPQLTFASRREYSMADEGAAAAELLELRETLRATQREAVQLFLSNSVAQHRVLPRDVHTFERLFPNGGDIQSAQRFVQQTPCPSPDRMRVTTLEHVHHDGVVVETRPRVAAEHFSRAVDGGREMFTTHGRAALPSEVPREADGSIPVWYKIEQARINQFRADPGAGERWKFESGEK